MAKDEREIRDIWFEFDEWRDGYSETDENADVIFELSDGSRYCGTFFTYANLESQVKRLRATGECLFGKYFLADKPIFVEKMSKQLIISVINDILKQGGIDSAFCKIN